jgi:carboxylesterase
MSIPDDYDSNILAGAEPWSAVGGAHGALVLHGFTGSPQSVRSLGHAFHAGGFTVDVPRLPGHGTTPDDMAETSWRDWTAAVDRSYRALADSCDRVVVAGLSMGGALSLWLAAEHPEIAGVVAVNPLVDAPALGAAREAATAALAAGERFLPAIGNDIAKPGVHEIAYDYAPAACTISALDGVAALAPRLRETRVPLLLFQSLQDHVIPPSSRELLEASYGGRLEVVELTRSFHVATLDYDAEEIERRAVEFALAMVAAS